MKDIKWTIGNIIDFEYFLKQDTLCNDEDYIKKRDRNIYLDSIVAELSPELSFDLSSELTGYKEQQDLNLNRTRLLLWLKAMKNQNILAASKGLKDAEIFDSKINKLLPGDIYEECLSLLKILFMVAGLGSGILLCLAFFSYSGNQPLNVAYFFALTLVPQIFFLIAFAFFFLICKFQSINKHKNRIEKIEATKLLLYPFWSSIIEKSLIALSRKTLAKLSAEKRDAFISAISTIRQGHHIYGHIFFMPVFIMVQIFGIAFNSGVLIYTVFRVIFFDTAFGWQSTLNISPEAVAKLVEAVATPWKWFIAEGVGFPDINQIIGSRIILKDGIYHLSTNDLTSWWPFLCLAILFYGLLPRIMLFISGVISLNRSLKQHRFDHASCVSLIRRMIIEESYAEFLLTSEEDKLEENKLEEDKLIDEENRSSYIESKSESLFPKIEPKPELEPESKPELKSEPKPKPKPELKSKVIIDDYKPCIALVPEDIYVLINIDTLKQLIPKAFMYDVRKIFAIGIDFDNEINCISTEYQQGWAIVIIQEAWQPPIKETLNFIKAIRKVVDKKTPITVVLIGQAVTSNIHKNKDEYKDKQIGITAQSSIYNHTTELQNYFTPVEKADWDIWKMKISTVTDPWLNVEKAV